jgi:hypothetical protein
MTYHSKCSDRLAAHQYVVQACGGQPGVYVTFIETRFWDTISQEHERGEKWRLQGKMETSGQHLYICARLPRNWASEDPIALTVYTERIR